MSIFSRSKAMARAKATTKNVPDTCQAVTRGYFNAPAAGDVDKDGDADAWDGWLSEPVRYRHPGDRNPPPGVPLSFRSIDRRRHGHRAISTDGVHYNVRSTDFSSLTRRYKKGVVGNGTIAQVEKAMNVEYLGWSETIDGKLIPNDLSTSAPAVPTESTPVEFPETRWDKVALVNHACGHLLPTKELKRYAKYLSRRNRLVEITTKKVRPDTLMAIELGPTRTFSYFYKKYLAAGYSLVPGGKTGRHLFVDNTVTDIRKSGVIEPTRYKGNDVPAPYYIGLIDGTEGMRVGFHLDFAAPTSVKVQQARDVVNEAMHIAAIYGLGPNRIVFAGDQAETTEAVRNAFKALGYFDAFDTAKVKINRKYKSYNAFKAQREGQRDDAIFVWRGDGKGTGDKAPRPVAVINQRLDNVATDHNVIAAVIDRIAR